jgi:hypothetical protein
LLGAPTAIVFLRWQGGFIVGRSSSAPITMGRRTFSEGQIMSRSDPAIAQTLPSTAWKEIRENDEQTLFQGFAEEIKKLQEKVAAGGTLGRGFHNKIHAGLRAEFCVMADRSEQARYGVFSEQRTFPALVRFSNGDSFRNPDSTKEPRGIAIKLIGVPGRKLLPGREDAVTQDFLATSHSVTSAVQHVSQFMDFIRATRHGSWLPVSLVALRRSVGIGQTGRFLRVILKSFVARVRSMITEQYSSTAPIKLGPYAVKFVVIAKEGCQGTNNQPASTDNFLHDDLVERLKSDIVLDFLVQFYVDDVRTPIEDTSVKWDTPLHKVAELRIPKCNPDSPEGIKLTADVNKLSFSPWHTTEDHRPLGNVMRARRVAYEASSTSRGREPEPSSVL